MVHEVWYVEAFVVLVLLKRSWLDMGRFGTKTLIQSQKVAILTWINAPLNVPLYHHI